MAEHLEGIRARLALRRSGHGMCVHWNSECHFNVINKQLERMRIVAVTGIERAYKELDVIKNSLRQRPTTRSRELLAVKTSEVVWKLLQTRPMTGAAQVS